METCFMQSTLQDSMEAKDFVHKLTNILSPVCRDQSLAIHANYRKR
jgi:hypothetical protein